jgi:hypothetical protein
MLGGETRHARRTERYLDGLMAADERRGSDLPVDAEMDPGVRAAARHLRADLVRVHPSFRFEEALAARLNAGALRLRAGKPLEVASDSSVMPGTIADFHGRTRAGQVSANVALPSEAAAATPLVVPAALGMRRFPEISARQSRPLIMGGVGVASAAISIGAVYVAWRHSHPASGRMGRAARAAHGRSTPFGRRRTGVINGILGVVS